LIRINSINFTTPGSHSNGTATTACCRDPILPARAGHAAPTLLFKYFTLWPWISLKMLSNYLKVLKSVLLSMRPEQWIKNLFVFTAFCANEIFCLVFVGL
jgi:hypothetical protein